MSGYNLTHPIAEADRAAALAFAEEALKPAGEELVIAELGRLRALTASRDIGQDLTLVFAAYADELMRYPADAVRDVLRGWRGKFWPTWAELAEQLNRLVAPRKALREALRRGYGEPEAPEWTPPSAEEKAAVAELLARHGYPAEYHEHNRPVEQEPMTAEDRRRVAAETRAFRLPPENDPRVRARLREMGIVEPEVV